MNMKGLKKSLTVILIFLLSLNSGPIVFGLEAFKDIEGHPFETIIMRHLESGDISGYSDGQFKPDQNITIAETMVMLNNILGLQHVKGETLEEGKNWYDLDAENANYYGYLEGIRARMDEPASRLDFLKILNVLLDIDEEPLIEAPQTFEDIKNLTDENQKIVNAFAQRGYISSDFDNLFNAQGTMTRAEFLDMTDNVTGYVIKTQEDTLHIPKDVKKITISASNIILEGLDTDAELYIASGVEGDVTIKDSLLRGKVIMSGGAPDHQLVIENSDFGTLVVTKSYEQPNIAVKGNSKIGTFKTRCESEVQLLDQCQVEAFESEAPTKLTTQEGVNIKSLMANAPVNIEGQGKLESARINANVEVRMNGQVIENGSVDNPTDNSDKDSSNHSSGGSQTPSTPPEVTKDTTPPSGYSVHFDAAEINQSNLSSLSFTISDGEINANYDYEISDGDHHTISGSGTILSNAEQITGVDATSLSKEGDILLKVKLTDTSLNEGEEVTDTKVLNLPPSDFSVAFETAYINSSHQTAVDFALSHIAEDVVKCIYSIDDTDVGTSPVTGSVTIDSHTGYVDQTISPIDVTSLTEGTLTLTVKLEDQGGYQSSDKTATILKDTMPPSGYQLEMVTNPVLKDNESHFTFQIKQNESGATYYYTIDDSDDTTTAVTGSDQSVEETVNLSDINVSTLADGTLTLKLYLVDEYGNQGTEISQTVNKDTSVPEITGLTSSKVTPTTFSFTVTSNKDASLYYKVLPSSQSPANQEQLLGETPLQITKNTGQTINITGLENYTDYTYYILLRDSIGNVSQEIKQVTCKTAALTYEVYTAQTIYVCGLYDYKGLKNERPYYEYKGKDVGGSNTTFTIFWEPDDTQWQLLNGNVPSWYDPIDYYINSSALTPPEQTWMITSGNQESNPGDKYKKIDLRKH